MKKIKKELGAYRTYALAEKAHTDHKTKAARPSDRQVEECREWSIENKQ